MEHDLRSMPRSPADSLGIPKPLVANRDSKREGASLEYLTLGARCVHPFFRRVELHLVLKAGLRAICIDHERGDARLPVDDTLRSKNDDDLRRGRRSRDRG